MLQLLETKTYNERLLFDFLLSLDHRIVNKSIYKVCHVTVVYLLNIFDGVTKEYFQYYIF